KGIFDHLQVLGLFPELLQTGAIAGESLGVVGNEVQILPVVLQRPVQVFVGFSALGLFEERARVALVLEGMQEMDAHRSEGCTSQKHSEELVIDLASHGFSPNRVRNSPGRRKSGE